MLLRLLSCRLSSLVLFEKIIPRLVTKIIDNYHDNRDKSLGIPMYTNTYLPNFSQQNATAEDKLLHRTRREDERTGKQTEKS